MPISLGKESIENMSDEELLLQCVQEYADPQNYEPYEKDYGTGRPAMRMPAIARGKGCHARATLEAYNNRILERNSRQPTCLEAQQSIGRALRKVPKIAVIEMDKGAGKSPAHLEAHLLTFSYNAKKINPAQAAYLRMYRVLQELQDSGIFNDLDGTLQDDINEAEKAGRKWI